ncbi:hypothetical protein PoB_002331200 [Plakobranchus ocellatus]|uniref:Uncharacterized protein n=1 Tax=Plakobranchus ocellatus TaxID=259542 RepID=A0AAV3ZQ61_9GAST|nr:hypothetical protein PoB_002331200 [Plakobranchus ocellatus]
MIHAGTHEKRVSADTSSLAIESPTTCRVSDLNCIKKMALKPSVRPGRQWRGSKPRQKDPCRSRDGLTSHCAIDTQSQEERMRSKRRKGGRGGGSGGGAEKKERGGGGGGGGGGERRRGLRRGGGCDEKKKL